MDIGLNFAQTVYWGKQFFQILAKATVSGIKL